MGVPVAGLAALTTLMSVSLLPPKLHHKPLMYATASSQLSVSAPGSASATPSLTTFYTLQQWSQVLAEEMTSPLLIHMIADTAGIPPGQLAIDGPISTDLQRTQQEPTGEKRSAQLLTEADPYRIQVDTNAALASIAITARAPTEPAAMKLVGASEDAIKRYLTTSQETARTPRLARVQITDLAPVVPTGGTRGHTVTALVFVIVFVLWIGLVAFVDKLRRELSIIATAQKRGLAQIRMPSVRSSVSRHF
jgi:hypothetical protein